VERGIFFFGMILLAVTIPATAMSTTSDLDKMFDGAASSDINALSAANFIGTWINTNPNANGMIKFVITRNLLSGYKFQGFGKCSPTSCNWGVVPLVLYSNSVSSLNDIAGTAKYQFSFLNTLVTLRIVNSTYIVANDYNQFTDGSGRHNYLEENMVFKKVRISTQIKLSPRNGSEFTHYPRTTTLKWSSVSSAASYTVEIDCYNCCMANRWCTDIGRTWQVVPDIRATSYTFDFVGAQPGRWRVWAVDASGQASLKSGWWYFTYTI
jgi:hypothetical protein